MNSNIIYESKVTTFNSAATYWYAKKAGYRLLSAINGDWNAQAVRVTGVSRQYDTDIVFFERAVTGSMGQTVGRVITSRFLYKTDLNGYFRFCIH